jgi:hypothetical protein
MGDTCKHQDGGMPTWLVITFKTLLTIGAVAILVGMFLVVKNFSRKLTQKVTMIILYVAILGAVLLNTL